MAVVQSQLDATAVRAFAIALASAPVGSHFVALA
jgi:hypothetical protein